jgi:hypothetical protein
MRRLETIGARSCLEGLLPDMHSVGVLFEEGDFPVVVAESGDTAVIGPLDEFAAGGVIFYHERYPLHTHLQGELLGGRFGLWM